MDEWKAAELRFRDAVQTGDFEAILEAAQEYRRSFDEHWRQMTLAQRRQSGMPDESALLMKWAVSVVRASRAVLADRHRASSAAGRYLTNGRGDRSRTWGAAG
jgi:hypothetical protein